MVNDLTAIPDIMFSTDMTGSVFYSETEQLRNDLNRLNTNVALIDTFMRAIAKETTANKSDILACNTRINEYMKKISEIQNEMQNEINIIIEYKSLPWYKKVFTNFKKFKNGRN